MASDDVIFVIAHASMTSAAEDADRRTPQGAPSSSVWSLVTASRVLAKVTGEYKRGQEFRLRKVGASEDNIAGMTAKRRLTRVGSMPERQFSAVSVGVPRSGNVDDEEGPSAESVRYEARQAESGNAEVMQMMREIMSGVEGIKEQVLEEINSLKKEISGLKKQVTWTRSDHNTQNSLLY